jgi:hypothetical protein
MTQTYSLEVVQDSTRLAVANSGITHDGSSYYPANLNIAPTLDTVLGDYTATLSFTITNKLPGGSGDTNT